MSATNRSVAKSNVERSVRHATTSPLMETMTRLGYGVRGVIYIIVSLLAFQYALGKGSAPATPQGAIAEIAKQPFGMFLLYVVLAGTISYSLWGVARALLDQAHKGNQMKGLITRIGFLVSALIYAFLAYFTYGYITGHSQSANGSQTQKFIAAVMAMPFGRLIIGIIGLLVLVAGIYQVYQGFTAGFDRQFQTYALTQKEIKVTTQVGRFGTAARGLVFSIIGILITMAAYRANASQPIGMDAALAALLNQPYGIWLVEVVAAGLLAFGFYSLLSAAWFRLKR